MRGTSLAVWWTVLVFHEDSSIAIHLSCPRCHPVGHWVDRYPVDYQTIGAVTWLHFRRTEPHSGCQEQRYFPRLSSDPVLSLLYLSSDHANIEFFFRLSTISASSTFPSPTKSSTATSSPIHLSNSFSSCALSQRPSATPLRRTFSSMFH